MIPTHNTIEQIDEIDAEEISFGIGDPRWVMYSLSDLYSNRELACVREYSTNAFDANSERAEAEGREPDPIEVSLPTLMNPYFTVRDYGDGMDRATLTEVYTQFGESTKRNSNLTNGMLGFGSKSAVAYTDTFTVTSIHGGTKLVAVIYRKPDWSISMKVVSESLSGEPSGTEIKIPVHNHDEFRHKASDFYRFWFEGTVKVDGEFPKQAVGEEIAPGLYRASTYGESRVVMGNVAYRINNPAILFNEKGMDPIDFVAFVPNGAVEFVPNREDLKYSEKTEKALYAVINDFADKVMAEAQADIDKATDHAAAYDAWVKWSNIVGSRAMGQLKFKNNVFTQRFPFDGWEYRLRDTNSYYNRRSNSWKINHWNVSDSPHTMYVTGFGVEMSSYVKAKAKQYRDLKGWSNVTRVLFTAKADVDCEWIRKDKVVSWEDLKAALPKKPRVANGTPNPNSGRIAGSWDYWSEKGWHSEEPIPAKKTNLFWIGLQESKSYSETTIISRLGLKDVAVIVVPGNREAKFKRENPKVKPFIEFAKTKIEKDGNKFLSARAKEIMALDSEVKAWAKVLDLNKVDDPAWKALAGIDDELAKLRVEYDRNIELAQSLRMPWGYGIVDVKTTASDYFKMYPLLKQSNIRYNAVRGNVKGEFILYMNAAYAARKDG